MSTAGPTASTPPVRDIWTRFVIDPLADPLASRLARHRVVTPNRVTLLAGLLGLGAITCFATGHLRTGGVLFLLRFFADCVDGKVARAQGTGSSRGALLDVGTDVVCVVGAYAALVAWTTANDHLAPLAGAVLMGALGCYGWSLAHRKHLAHLAGRGGGGSRLLDREDLPVLGRWLDLCRRLHMRPVPWAVEAETLTLGLLPLLGAGPAAGGLLLAAAFYVAATIVNLLRLARLAAVLDRPSPARAVPAGSES
jgi:phosphatidylglycerophosphate synthase